MKHLLDYINQKSSKVLYDGLSIEEVIAPDET